MEKTNQVAFKMEDTPSEVKLTTRVRSITLGGVHVFGHVKRIYNGRALKPFVNLVCFSLRNLCNVR